MRHRPVEETRLGALVRAAGDKTPKNKERAEDPPPHPTNLRLGSALIHH
jgi:hypothetical protein